jgi:hypothetical protein
MRWRLAWAVGSLALTAVLGCSRVGFSAYRPSADAPHLAMEPSASKPGDIVWIRISGHFSGDWLHANHAFYEVYEDGSWHTTAILFASASLPRMLLLPTSEPIDLSLGGVLVSTSLMYRLPEGAPKTLFRICKDVSRRGSAGSAMLCT